METIDLNKNIAQLMREHPALAQVLSEMGIDCADCLASQVDTLADVVRMYRLDLNAILERVRQRKPDGGH